MEKFKTEKAGTKRARQELGAKTADDGDDHDNHSTRDCSKLFAESETIHCALHRACVPCAYKIGTYDVSLDRSFCSSVPNQRPELCPRAKVGGVPKEGTLGYRCRMKVLTVGDGDLSFSVAIMRLLCQHGDIGSGELVATSFETQETLERVYPNFLQNLEELHRLGAKVSFKVDATRLKETMGSDELAAGFTRIVWNFPCTAIQSGKDGQNDEMNENKELVRKFVKSARHLLAAGGEIHMCHKTKPPFNQWDFEQVAVEESLDEDPIVYYRGRVVLDRCTLHPYAPRKALDRKSFPCHDACTYIFGLSRDEENLRSGMMFASTLPADDGGHSSSLLQPVTTRLIETIRAAHLGKRVDKSSKSSSKKKRFS